MGKAKSKNWALGGWSIDSMSMWDNDYIDAEVPGHFEFGADNLGSFQFNVPLNYLFSVREWTLTARKQGLSCWDAIQPNIETSN